MLDWFKRKSNSPVEILAPSQPKLEKKNFVQYMFGLADAESEYSKQPKDFVVDGFLSNPIVKKCIDIRVQGVSSIQIELHMTNNVKKEVLVDHPILNLINKPNPNYSKKELFKRMIIDLDSTGSCYLLVLKDSSGTPFELINLSSLDMTVEQGATGVPTAYIYKKNTKDEKRYSVDPVTSECDALCIKNFNPLSTQLGLSPLQACYRAIEVLNNGLKHNSNLLKNGARPSGTWNHAELLTDEQFDTISEMIRQFNGPSGAGKTPLLENGLTFNPIGQSNKDMDYLEGINQATGFIAGCLGVPLPLVLESAATYSNVKESTLTLYENTIIPLCEDLLEPIGNWLIPMFKKSDRKAKVGVYQNLSLQIDRDSISALQPRRDAKTTTANELLSSGAITPNEAREMMGYPTIEDDEGANKLRIPMAKPQNNPANKDNLNQNL